MAATARLLRMTILTGMAASIPLLATPAKAQAETIIASDNFNRPNEIPFATTGNWGRVIAGNYDGVSHLVSNEVTSASNEGIYYWKGAGTFNPTRQFARQRVVQDDGELGLVLLGGPDHAIMMQWGPPGVGNTLYIYWYKDGQDQAVLSQTPATINNGDIIEGVLDGGIIYAKVNGAVVASVANTTTLTTGNPGFITYLNPSLPAQVSKLDDWRAGTPASYTISGTITENAAGLGGVLVSASGGFSGTATTNGAGAYTITGVPAGTESIVLTPTLSGHTMSPTTRTVAGPVNANVTGQDFTSTVLTHATLTINALHGSVTRNPDLPTYTLGTNVTLTPIPDAGYDFVGWSGDVPVGDEFDNPLVLTMNQNRTITAHFVSPGAVASDNFNRPNETPLTVGGNWQRAFGGGLANLTSNHVAGASGEAMYYWQGPGTFDNTRQYARARVVQAGGQVGLVLLGGSNQAIAVAWGFGQLYIYWYSNGDYQAELASQPSTLQVGDEIEAVLEQGRIFAKVNGVVIRSVANTTSLTSGRPGFEAFQSGGALDDWEAGTPQDFSIAGTITENASGLSGVLVTATGGHSGNATTGIDGTYTIVGVPSGVTSVVLTPTLVGHSMAPVTRTVTGPVLGNVSGQDFESTLITGAVLTIEATHGAVSRDPDLAEYPFGSVVALTPVPDPGYHFTRWAGDVPQGDETDNPLFVTMNQDRTITAIFVSSEVLASDYFERPDESPLVVGGDWQKVFASATANLTSHRVTGTPGDAPYYWQGAGAFSNSRQFARARVAQTGGEVGLVLLGGTSQGIVLSWFGGQLYFYWWLNGTHQGDLLVLPWTLAVGDTIEAVLDSGTIYGKVNGVIVGSVANSTSLSSGRPGFQTYLPGGALDDWEAGTLAVVCAGAPNGTPCNDANACTVNDACTGGTCSGTAVPSPAEVQGVILDGQTPTGLTWSAASGAVYDVASGALSDLRVSGTTTAACLSNNLATAGYSDVRPDPAPGAGYYYITRAQGACGPGTYGFASAGPERVPTAACP
jgi:List-Bact-rpt repeat protein